MASNKTTSRRLMGPSGSAIWHQMLDATEDILRKEGYGALTSRRVAERIGVQHRLIYYYFHTMDDLIVQTFRRRAVRERERLQQALVSEQPIHQIWEVCAHIQDADLISEFLALAKRIAPLRKEIVVLFKEYRALLAAALASAFERRSIASRIPPVALAMLTTNIALSLIREAELGVKTGHPEVLGVVADFLSELEPVSKVGKPDRVKSSGSSTRRKRKSG